MANRSGVSGQVISLPRGGGTQHGIGETFAPDLHTGTRTFSAATALPSGRNGFQPQFCLRAGAGNGPVGLGWRVRYGEAAP
jgi:Salmonella virulence plasmid 65kDa B protein